MNHGNSYRPLEFFSLRHNPKWNILQIILSSGPIHQWEHGFKQNFKDTVLPFCNRGADTETLFDCFYCPLYAKYTVSMLFKTSVVAFYALNDTETAGGLFY